MSQRETEVKPLVLTTVGGVNERSGDVDLPAHEYSFLTGVFPEFAGLQSRLWGKRLLALYPDAVYGIFQFWTPLGYAGGVYQFDDHVDFGAWITPTTEFDLGLPDLETDGGGMTEDDFGDGYGDNFDYGDNLCTLSFLNGSLTHEACNDPSAPLGTPNDSNGGPGGQGKHCRWALVPEDAGITYSEAKFGIYHFADPKFVNLGVPPVTPPPPPNPLSAPIAIPASFDTSTGTISAFYIRTSDRQHYAFETWLENQVADVQSVRLLMNFSGGIKAGGERPVRTTIKVQHTNVGGVILKEHPIEIDYDDPVDVEVMNYDYLDTSVPETTYIPGGAPGGFKQEDQIVFVGVRYYYRRRVCS